MRLQDDIDFTTLSWVKAELDATFRQARQALEAFVDDPADRGQMRACAHYLHQVRGTLRMVELQGPALAVEEMEKVAQALLEEKIADRDEAFSVLMRGLLQLPDYLDRLQSGHKDVPVVLLPLVNELRALQGEGQIGEQVLFSPDLSLPLPASVPGAPRPAPVMELGLIAERLRAGFQRALLAWYRGADGEASLHRMAAILDRLTELGHEEAARKLWWVGSALVDALAKTGGRPDNDLKLLLGKLEREIKRLSLQGELSFRVEPPRELLRGLLYQIARFPADTPRLEAVRRAFRLSDLRPASREAEHAQSAISGHNRALLDTVAKAIKEDLLRVKDSLDVHLRSGEKTAAGLEGNLEILSRVADTLAMLGLDSSRQLVVEQRTALAEMVSGDRGVEEGALLDIAGALLYVEGTLDDQVEMLGSRPAQVEGDDQFSRSEARRVIEAVAREAGFNLQKVKDDFVAFIESPWDHDKLRGTSGMLTQVAGALRILEQREPALIAIALARFVDRELVRARRVPTADQMDRVADVLASLEYYFEATREHRAGRERILEVAKESMRWLGYWPIEERLIVEAEEAPVEEEERMEPAEAGAIALERPEAPTAAGEEEPAAVDEATPAPGPQPAVEPGVQAAAATAEPSRAPSEAVAESAAEATPAATMGFELLPSDEIDEEIREVFIEEVREEIANLNELFPQWLEQIEDLERLKPIRRSFHTLKGSGRLVGARALGEFSWKVENMLNRVLDRTITPHEGVIALVRHALEALPEMLAALEGRGAPGPIVAEIMSVADRLAQGEQAWVGPAPVAAEVEEAAPAEAEGLPAPLPELEAPVAAPFVEAPAEEPEPMAEAVPEAVAETAFPSEGAEPPAAEAEILEEPLAEPSEPQPAPLAEPVPEPALPEPVAPAPAVEAPEVASAEAAPVAFDRMLAELEATLEPVAEAPGEEPAAELVEQEEPRHEALSEASVPAAAEPAAAEAAEAPALERPIAVDPVLLEILRTEVNGHLEVISAYLAACEAQGAALPVSEAVQRAAHTMNGAFAMVDVPAACAVAAPLEGYLKRLLAAGRAPDRRGLDALREAVGAIAAVVVALEYHEPMPETEGLARALAALRDELPAPAPRVRGVEEEMAATMVEVDAGPEPIEAVSLPPVDTALLALGEPVAEEAATEEAVSEEAVTEEAVTEEAVTEEAVTEEAVTEEAVTEEAVTEEAVTEEAVTEEAVTEEAVTEEAVTEEAVTEEAVTEEAVAEEAVAEEAVTEEAVAEEAVTEEAVTEEAVTEEAVTEEAVTEEAVTEEAVTEEAVTEEAVTEEAVTEEAVTEEAVAEEAVAEEAVAEEAVAEEAVTEEAVTEEAVAEEAVAEEAVAEEAVAEEAVAEEAVAEEAVTEEAVTEEAVTEEAVAEEAVTEEAVTEEAVTEEAVTEEAVAESQPAWPPIEDPADPEGPLDLPDLDPDLLEIFVQEAEEILDSADRLLARLREAPREREIIVGLQRELHTLKGGARMAGLSAVADLGHALESLFEAAADGRHVLGRASVEILERAFDRLHAQVTRVRNRRAVARATGTIERLEALARGAAAPARPLPPQPAPAPVLPAEEPVPAPVPRKISVPTPTEAEVSEEEARVAGQEYIRVRADLLDRLVNYAGEVAIYRGRLDQQVGVFRFNLSELEGTVSRLREQLRRLEIETEAQILSRYQREGDQQEIFDPLELDRFSTLQQLSRALAESVSDLVSLTNLLDDNARQAETLLLQQSRVSSELQDGLMRTRMVPFEGLVPRLRRLVRQVARELGRKAQLRVEGAQGEMDRSVLERMVAPLEHMLRNALAHGIEPPAERIAAGKPEEGTVRIRIGREATEVVIQVSDDGRGMDREAIRRKAIERGLLKPEVQLSDRDLFGFILESGFSTATEVSQIAGRGVGMDVVASEIKQLGGSLQIASERGRGTEFTIRLPFTLAVAQAVLVKLGETTFAVPISSVQGIARIHRDEYVKRITEGPPTISYAGEEYVIHDLSVLLDLPVARSAEETHYPLLLSRTGDQRSAVRVDVVLGSREIVVKPVGPQISSVPGVFGATILGDGSVVVILDMAPLVRRAAALRETTQAALAPLAQPERVEAAPAAAEKRPRLIMVVDDSITMRKVTGRTLERHDYEVVTAKDGLDAVEKLQERVPDVMLLDIEMPRMDGYELATYVRNDPRLRHIPIIMITSRTGEKHRQRAFEIGVNRYLGKPYQEAELLRTVAEMLQEARE